MNFFNLRIEIIIRNFLLGEIILIINHLRIINELNYLTIYYLVQQTKFFKIENLD